MDLLFTDNELQLDSHGRLRQVSGAELVAQRIRWVLNTHVGEWCWNTSVGVDYVGAVFRKAPDLDYVRDIIVAAVSGVQGVARVGSVEYSTSGRQFRISFAVTTSDGEVIVATGNGSDVAAAVNALGFSSIAEAYFGGGVQ